MATNKINSLGQYKKNKERLNFVRPVKLDRPIISLLLNLNYIYIYITLHYITLHYITLHYITLHYITLHYITLHYITLHYITLHLLFAVMFW